MRQFLAAFAELDEGLVGRERVLESMAKDAVVTFSGFGFEDGQTLRWMGVPRVPRRLDGAV